jgi:hypothetical protein
LTITAALWRRNSSQWWQLQRIHRQVVTDQLQLLQLVQLTNRGEVIAPQATARHA